jgi:ABC-type maltose transport system permease subunit
MPSSTLPLVSMFLILQRWGVKGLTEVKDADTT